VADSVVAEILRLRLKNGCAQDSAIDGLGNAIRNSKWATARKAAANHGLRLIEEGEKVFP
jgi:hypothetical protein